MKYLSLFSGIGGFELAIQQAYDNRQKTNNQRGSAKVLPEGVSNLERNDVERSISCVGYSEIDKYAVQIYNKHFNHKNYGDITKLDPSTLPDFDFLCGGFPCQAFSIAGKRRGFEDTRGTLFFDIARILRAKQPRLLLLENVKGLLSHDSGRSFSTIIASLGELGYDLQWQVLNSKNFGVPQNRERVFIIGHLRGTSRPQVFPFRGDDTKNIEPGKEVCATLKSRYPGDWNGNYVQRQPLRFLNRNQKNIEGDYAFTVDASQTSGVRKGMKIRRLTPTECERLQGFPDGWTEGISDTQRYKCLGNAVTVNVIKEIVKRTINKTN